MPWINRLRLFGGLLGVTVLACLLTLVFNQRQTEATSLNAQVSADQYVISAAYSGTVTKSYVELGDTVTKGDKLFTVQSVDLQQDISNGLKIESTDAYDVDPKRGTLTYKAVVSGTVTELTAKPGASQPTAAELATLTVDQSQFVEASYLLSPNEYARVEKGATVRIVLPNNKTIEGTVTSVKVETDNGQARTTIRVDSDALRTDESVGDFSQPGTPVTATLQLRDDGPLAGVRDLVIDFLRQIGVR